MRHRNDTDRPLTVATVPPQTVEPGEEVDTPDHVAGMTCLDQPCPPLATGGVVTYSGVALVGEDDVAPPAPRAARRRTTDTAEEA